MADIDLNEYYMDILYEEIEAEELLMEELDEGDEDENVENLGDNENNRNDDVNQTNSDKKKSLAWKYFESIDKLQAKCSFCGKIYQTSRNTSNMRNHVSSKHGVIFPDSKKKDDPNSDVPPLSREERDRINRALATYIIQGSKTVTIVRDEPFREFLQKIIPGYVIPSSETIKQIQETMYHESVELIKKTAETCESLSITADTWTSPNNVSYLGVTYTAVSSKQGETVIDNGVLACIPAKGHTSDDISDQINTVLDSYNVDRNKLTAITTDNAPNMLKAAKNIGAKYTLGCYAHQLNLVLKNVVPKSESVSQLITKIRSTVTHFRQSSNANSALKSRTPLTPLLNNTTRWNSTYTMLNRYNEILDPIQLTCADIGKHEFILSGPEITLLKKIIPILRIYFDATKNVEGNNATTHLCNSVTEFINDKLALLLTTNETDTDILFLIGELMKENDNRLGKEYKNTYDLANFFDPHNNEDLKNDRNLIATVTSLIEARARNDAQEPLQSTEPVPSTSSTNCRLRIDDSFQVWGRKKKQKTVRVSAESRKADEEISAYLTAAEPPEHVNILQYWERSALKHLRAIFLQLCSMNPTSCASERLFSAMRYLINLYRTRLSPETINQQMVIKHCKL